MSASLALAKEGPEKLTISGPGLKGVVEVTDPQLLNGLLFEGFIARHYGSIRAPQVGDAYELTSFYKEDNQYKPSNRLRYYLSGAGPGFVYYVGAGEFGHVSNDDGKWFCAAPQRRTRPAAVAAQAGRRGQRRRSSNR